MESERAKNTEENLICDVSLFFMGPNVIKENKNKLYGKEDGQQHGSSANGSS